MCGWRAAPRRPCPTSAAAPSCSLVRPKIELSDGVQDTGMWRVERQGPCWQLVQSCSCQAHAQRTGVFCVAADSKHAAEGHSITLPSVGLRSETKMHMIMRRQKKCEDVTSWVGWLQVRM